MGPRAKNGRQEPRPSEGGQRPLPSKCVGGSVEDRLRARLAQLEEQLDAGEDVWMLYCVTAQTLAALLRPVQAPGERAGLLTTKQMALKLGVASKTLLAHRRRGTVRAALTKGKLIRWKGTERLE